MMMNAARTLIRVLLFLALAALAGACVDHAYDFDRTDKSATLIGEDITLPLGDTGPMTVSSLLGDKMGDYLVPLDDGTLSIQYKGNPVSFVFDELKKIDGAAPFARFCDFPISYDFALFNKPAAPTYDAKGEASLAGSIPAKVQLNNVSRTIESSISNMPKELAALKSITLTDKSRVDLTLTIPNCPFISGTVTPDFSFDLGSFFESEDFPEGIIKFTKPLDASNGYTVTETYPLHKFALDPKSFNPSDHSLNVKATIRFSGSCTFTKPRTNKELFEKAPKTVQLKVTATMRDIACKEIEGAFNYARKSQVTFPLGDFSAGLSDKLSDNVFFDFVDPTILLDIESNITIPISAKLTLAARQKRVKYAEVKGIPVDFPVPAPGATASKRIRMSHNPAQYPGEESVSVDFTQLLARIPDDMLITADAATKSDKTAVLRLGEDVRVKVSPQVIIPLSFGPEMKVEMRDTIALPAKLGGLIKDNTFQVVGTIDNGFPMQVSFRLVMVDEDGTALTEPIQQTIAAGASTDLSLTLATLPGTDPVRLSSAILAFEADGIPESRPVKADDAVQAKLHIVIPGGYHLTL